MTESGEIADLPFKKTAAQSVASYIMAAYDPSLNGQSETVRLTCKA